MKRIGLTLGGGGARGLCQIGFLKVLDEFNVKPVVISGTSIGAIIGAFYASGLSGKQIEKILDDINFRDLLKMFDPSFLSRTSLIKGRGIEVFLKEKIPASTFEELQIPLKIVATDFWRRNDIVYDSGELIPAIRASMSIPALFKPVVFENRVLTDGGASNILPFDLIREDCDLLIAIDVSGSLSVPATPKIPNWFENIMNTYQIMQSAMVEYQMKSCQPDIYIKPALKDIGILDFEKSHKILRSVQEDVIFLRKELNKHLENKRKTPFFKEIFKREKS